MFIIKTNKIFLKYIAIFVCVITFTVLALYNSDTDNISVSESSSATLSYTQNGRSFSPDDFILNMGISSSFGTVTVGSLPEGQLLFDGEEIGEGFTFSIYEASLLSYRPKDNTTAQFTVSENDRSISVFLRLCEESNGAPECENIRLKTAQTVSLRETLPAFDSDGDEMAIKLLSDADKGSLSFNGTSFVYSPYPDSVGSDSFSYIVSDIYGNYSGEYKTTIEIEKVRESHLYDDMAGKSGYSAAVFLNEAGILCGERKGGLNIFSPDKEVCFEDLMVILSDITGVSESFTPCFSTGLESDEETEAYLKPYIKTALSQGIITDFYPNTTITKQEAYTFTAKILGLTEEASPTNKIFPNIHEIDSDALPYYLRLYEKGYITLADIKDPNSVFTKNDLARLVYNIVKTA